MSNNSLETKKITAYDLWEFLKLIQESFKEGYVLNDSVENFPISHIGFYTCGVVRYTDNLSDDKMLLKSTRKKSKDFKEDTLNEKESSLES